MALDLHFAPFASAFISEGQQSLLRDAFYHIAEELGISPLAGKIRLEPLDRSDNVEPGTVELAAIVPHPRSLTPDPANPCLLRPSFFTLKIDLTRDPSLILESLAHECVHLKQWLTGELAIAMARPLSEPQLALLATDDPSASAAALPADFRGLAWQGEIIGDPHRIAYKEQPWEFEPHHRQRALARSACAALFRADATA